MKISFEKFNQYQLFAFTEKFPTAIQSIETFVMNYAINREKMNNFHSCEFLGSSFKMSRIIKRSFFLLDMALRFDLFQLISTFRRNLFLFNDDFSILARPLKIFISRGHEVFPFFPIFSALFVFCISRFDVKKRFRILRVAVSSSAAPDDDEESEWMFPLMAVPDELQSSNDKSSPHDFPVFIGRKSRKKLI